MACSTQQSRKWFLRMPKQFDLWGLQFSIDRSRLPLGLGGPCGEIIRVCPAPELQESWSVRADRPAMVDPVIFFMSWLLLFLLLLLLLAARASAAAWGAISWLACAKTRVLALCSPEIDFAFSFRIGFCGVF